MGFWISAILNMPVTVVREPRFPRALRSLRSSGWKWGHDGKIDYPTEDLLPRGPLPRTWMDYHGHYRFGSEVVLSYQIDGRAILESPQARDGKIVQRLEIGPGRELKLAWPAANPLKPMRFESWHPENAGQRASLALPPTRSHSWCAMATSLASLSPPRSQVTRQV